MATKYKFCHYTFSDGSRATNIVRNYFCQEIFLQIKYRLPVTKFFITECLFYCSALRLLLPSCQDIPRHLLSTQVTT